jgi:plastocyanin
MANKAFAPDDINAKVGDTVTWTNKDTIFHTVTSGTGPSDTTHGKEFDSGLSGPTALTTQGKTFSHKFMTAGEFPYFCQLHPTMVGKVEVK